MPVVTRARQRLWEELENASIPSLSQSSSNSSTSLPNARHQRYGPNDPTHRHRLADNAPFDVPVIAYRRRKPAQD